MDAKLLDEMLLKKFGHEGSSTFCEAEKPTKTTVDQLMEKAQNAPAEVVMVIDKWIHILNRYLGTEDDNGNENVCEQEVSGSENLYNLSVPLQRRKDNQRDVATKPKHPRILEKLFPSESNNKRCSLDTTSLSRTSSHNSRNSVDDDRDNHCSQKLSSSTASSFREGSGNDRVFQTLALFKTSTSFLISRLFKLWTNSRPSPEEQ